MGLALGMKIGSAAATCCAQGMLIAETRFSVRTHLAVLFPSTSELFRRLGTGASPGMLERLDCTNAMMSLCMALCLKRHLISQH